MMTATPDGENGANGQQHHDRIPTIQYTKKPTTTSSTDTTTVLPSFPPFRKRFTVIVFAFLLAISSMIQSFVTTTEPLRSRLHETTGPLRAAVYNKSSVITTTKDDNDERIRKQQSPERQQQPSANERQEDNDKTTSVINEQQQQPTTTSQVPPVIQQQRCAIDLWGLPRSFKTLVLPSLIQNVIRPNAKYDCDYFVHYYDLQREKGGRSGTGGVINAHEVLLLKDAVAQVATELQRNRTPHVGFKSDTEEFFWKTYRATVKEVRTAKDDQGRFIYFPWRVPSYDLNTLDNIIKMWHTIQSSWHVMARYAHKHNFTYDRVGMMRSDVVYVTPIDIYQSNDGSTLDLNNTQAVIPGFSRYPVSDRLIYGPAAAVEIWATQRFPLLGKHAEFILHNDPGWGMQSERFVNYTLFPPMRKLGYSIVEHDYMCFLRARADETVWFTDCEHEWANITKPSIAGALGGPPNRQHMVEMAIGRECVNWHWFKRKHMPIFQTLNCTSSVTVLNRTTSMNGATTEYLSDGSIEHLRRWDEAAPTVI